MACAPRADSSLAPLRQLVNSVFHSMTSSSTSKKHSFEACCTNSFIGIGSIWPEPDAEVCTFTLSFLSAEKPASVISFAAASGSYLIWNFGLPRQGWPGLERAGRRDHQAAQQPSFISSRLMQRLAAWRTRLSSQGEPSTNGELPRPDMRLRVLVDTRSRAA